MKELQWNAISLLIQEELCAYPVNCRFKEKINVQRQSDSLLYELLYYFSTNSHNNYQCITVTKFFVLPNDCPTGQMIAKLINKLFLWHNNQEWVEQVEWHLEYRIGQKWENFDFEDLFFTDCKPFPTFLEVLSATEQWLKFFIRFSNSRGGYPSTQGTIRVGGGSKGLEES